MSHTVIVALHGVGSSAQHLAAALAPLEQVARVIALDGSEAYDGGELGRQWFSVAGVTEADRPMRVASALSGLLERLDQVARENGVDRSDLVLLGFSQGAIMTLALVAQGLYTGRVIAIAGRLASPVVPPKDQPAELLLVHDRQDRVMPPTLGSEASTKLAAAGHQVELVHTVGTGHGIGSATIAIITDWLSATDQSTPVPHQMKD